MARKTKVRVVGDPDLASAVAVVLSDYFEFENAPERFQRAVGRDYSHSDAPGVTIYLTMHACMRVYFSKKKVKT